MESPAPSFFPSVAMDRMRECAEADYPNEACGFVFGSGATFEVVPMENIQNRLHKEDPVTHTRDARTAYCFDPREMMEILAAREKAGVPLRAIYHSHPDHDAYFSETDSAAAAPFGEPSYPGVVHVVLSVRDKKVVDVKVFDWSSKAEAYAEIPLRTGD
jgi:proteasome lid subunit RPN8/RPN11